MKLKQFDFDLPEALIALRPARPRDAARLLVFDGAGEITDRTVRDLPNLLRPGDALVFNDTRVIPASLDGIRVRDGVSATIHANLHQKVNDQRWKAFVRGAKKLQLGDRINFGDGNGACLAGSLDAKVAEKGDDGEVTLDFDLAGAVLDQALAAVGHVPLPPYIASRRADDEDDRRDYQTIYAANDGAVAAPTAGLHFTEPLLETLKDRGIERHFVTLHVGAGTFLPVKVETIANHKMHGETGTVDAATAAALNDCRARGGRIVCVGTTSLRLLETAADERGKFHPWRGMTDIFITPGYRFRACDLLMTNFHLPKSTLFMLVAAFCGLKGAHHAYCHAIDAGYRFYSYGDAGLLYPRR